MRTLFLPPEIALTINKYCVDNRTIKTKCLICDSKFDNLLRGKDFENNFFVKKIHVHEYGDYRHGFYEIKDNESEERLGNFHFIQYRDELYVFTGENSKFWNNVLLKIIRILYPDVQSAFIHSNGIYQILDHFEQIKNLRLGIKRVVRKQIFGEEPRTEIAYEISKEEREYPSFKEAFQIARDYDLWIDRITVSSQNYLPKVQFSISRKGEVSFGKSPFDNYFSYVLAPIIEISKERQKQFKGRSRREQPDKKPKPLLVDFRKEIFEQEDTRHQFIKLLNKYTHCNYSVVHGGNPHIYVSIVDREDNSSFAIRTLGSNSLLLIPQVKTSALALMRFSEFLVTSFYEGEIQNYGKT